MLRTQELNYEEGTSCNALSFDVTARYRYVIAKDICVWDFEADAIDKVIAVKIENKIFMDQTGFLPEDQQKIVFLLCTL